MYLKKNYLTSIKKTGVNQFFFKFKKRANEHFKLIYKHWHCYKYNQQQLKYTKVSFSDNNR